MKTPFHVFTVLASIALLAYACQNEKAPNDNEAGRKEKVFHVRQMKVPVWARNANLYVVNIRHYTPEGTFNAFRKHLPRLKQMGISTLVFMPVYPISMTKRKGELGNPFSVADFTKINPEFGTFEEFRELVHEIHRMNMHVIMDWVPRHTGWDHSWLTTHSDWYIQSDFSITPAGEGSDESDVALLNYEVGAMQNTMIESMKFWLRAADVDGFRCADAADIPNAFWHKARQGMEQVKPVFMISEAENSDHLESCFQTTYARNLYDLFSAIVANKADADDLQAYISNDRISNPAGYFHLNFTSNYHLNSNEGPPTKRFGEAYKAMTVLAFTLEGIPLIYGGQEANNSSRLSQFQKDSIDWNDKELSSFFSSLIQLKNYNRSLWNGQEGGKLTRINEGNQIFAFKREKDGHRVFVLVNCTDARASTTISEGAFAMSELFGKQIPNIAPEREIVMEPYEYWVLSNPSVSTQ